MSGLASDKAVGSGIFGASIAGIIIYALLIIYAWEITIRVTMFIAVALVLGILAWIGYTMATTPPPEPLTEPETQQEKKEESSSQNK